MSRAADANDRMICFGDQLIDQPRRRLAALKMRLDGGERNFRQHEYGAAQLGRPGAAERGPRERLQAGLEALGLIGDAALQRRRPVAMDEIVAAVEHQQPRVIEMAARPRRRVERGAEAVAGLDRGDEALLKGEHGRQPQFAEQRVARREAVVERTLWRLEPLGDGVDGNGGRPALGDELAGRGQEAGLIESRSPHSFRLSV